MQCIPLLYAVLSGHIIMISSIKLKLLSSSLAVHSTLMRPQDDEGTYRWVIDEGQTVHGHIADHNELLGWITTSCTAFEEISMPLMPSVALHAFDRYLPVNTCSML